MREGKQKLSQQRVKNWPNTIQATREKKEKDRIRKLEEEEIDRRKVDAVEEALQSELRNEAINAANKQMFESQDRVKSFQSKMLMCDVLAERDEQQRLLRRKKKFQNEQDRQWNEYEKQQLEEAELAEKKKLEVEY